MRLDNFKMCGVRTASAAIAILLAALSARATEYPIPASDSEALFDALGKVKDGDVVRLAGGTYTTTNSAAYFFSITNAVSILGTDDPTETILDCGGGWGVKLDNQGALLAGVKLSAFSTSRESRAMYIPNGTVSNVYATGSGSASTTLKHVTYDNFTFGSGALVTDCRFAGFNSVQGGSAWEAKLTFAVNGATVRRTAFHDLQNYNYPKFGS